MHYMIEGDDATDLRNDLAELRDAIGLETHESTSRNQRSSDDADGSAAL